MRSGKARTSHHTPESRERSGGESPAPYDLVVRNGRIVTINSSCEIIENGFIAVTGDTISAIGPGGAESADNARCSIDARGGLVLPGLVNAHTHAAMSLFRGLADDLPLMDWLDHYIFPAERKLTGEWVYWGAMLAAAEMIRSGTTTFCDMYLFEDRVAEAAACAGMRAVVGEVLYDFDSPSYGRIENGLRFTRELVERWKGHPLISVAVEPHSAYTCSPELLIRARDLAEETDVPLITHLSESDSEVAAVVKRHGMRPVEFLDELGVLTARLIADHCVVLNDKEMDLLATRGVRVCHNAESNMKLASGVSPVPDLISRGVQVGLGTDGCASNNDLNMFGEMDTVAKLHKVIRKDPTIMDARTVVSMATRGGAAVLGMEHAIGSLEIGKKADLVVLDCRRPHMIPLFNPFSHLVYCANGSEVTSVVINGRPVLLEGRFTTLDEKEVFSRVEEIGRNIGEQRCSR